MLKNVTLQIPNFTPFDTIELHILPQNCVLSSYSVGTVLYTYFVGVNVTLQIPNFTPPDTIQLHILPQVPNGKGTHTTEMAQNKNSMSGEPRVQFFPSRWPAGYPK